MKYLIVFLIGFGQMLFGQNITNTLKGEFKTKSKDALYSYLNFDGAGQVDFSGYNTYPFFERNDSLIILVDKAAFVLKKNKDELVGISDWIEGIKYKSNLKQLMSIPQTNPELQKKAELYAHYYTENYLKVAKLFTDDLNDSHYNKIIDQLIIHNENLCNQNLDLGCIQVFSLKMTNEMGGVAAALNLSEDFVLKPNKYFEELGNKIIQLGNPEGYGLLASYHFLTREKEKADKFLEIGLEKGCQMCLTMALQNIEE